MKMQDARPRLRGTMVTELPVINAFHTCVLPREFPGKALSFLASRDTEDLLKINKVFRAQVIFISRGANLGVNR